MIKRLPPFAIIFAVLTASAAGLEAQSLSDTTLTIDNVVVSATRTKVNRNNIPLTISVVGREQIEQSSESSLLPVLSQQVPGLFVTQSGITGYGLSSGGGTINIRGVGQGDKVLTLIDGQPQWAGLFGHSIPDFFVASDIDRVEVVRGPGSLIYGSNAMGGVVNVLTREQHAEQTTLNARVMYGSHNTQKYMLNSGHKKGRWSSFLSFNHDRTDGHRENADFHITNGFGKVGYRINDNMDAILNVSLASFSGTNPGSIYDPIFDNTYKALRGTASLGVENSFGRMNGAVRFFYNFGKHEINDGYYASTRPRTYLFHSLDHNYGVLAYESFSLFRRNTFTVGIDYKNWGGRAWNKPIEGARTEGDLADKSVDETAGYLVVQQGIGNRININGGIRAEHNSAFGGEIIPQAGITYNPFGGTNLKAAFSKGFRSPNIRELYMFMPANPDLKPERMFNYEVSAGQSMWNGRVRAEITGFLLKAQSMITTMISNGKPLNVNRNNFTNRGVEAEVTVRVIEDLVVNANYSYLYKGETRIIGAPESQLFISASYNPGRFGFNLNMQNISGLYTGTDAGGMNVMGSYTLLNARAAYTFGNRQHITLFVKGENLTNRKYAINYGFPMPGAVVFAGVDIPLVLKKY